MLITKREEVTKQGFCKMLWSLLLEFIRSSWIYSLKWVGWGWALIWVRLGGGGGRRLFEAGRLLAFSAVRMGAYSRWALIRGWALIQINTVHVFLVLKRITLHTCDCHLFMWLEGMILIFCSNQIKNRRHGLTSLFAAECVIPWFTNRTP